MRLHLRHAAFRPLVFLGVFALGLPLLTHGDQARSKSHSWTYLLSLSFKPQKVLMKTVVSKRQRGAQTQWKLEYMRGKRRFLMAQAEQDAQGALVSFSLRGFGKSSFRRTAEGFSLDKAARSHPKLSHRTGLSAPAGSVLFGQGDLLGMHLVLSRLKPGWSGLVQLPYLYTKSLSLGQLYVAKRGTQKLRYKGKPVKAQKLLLFSKGGGALAYVGPRGQLLRAEVPLKAMWWRLEGSEQLTIPPRPKVPAKGIVHQEFQVQSGKARLAGVVATPASAKGKLPAVLMLSGSGPQDRNNDAPGMPMGIFLHLSNALAPMGMAVVRFDDRGYGKSTGSFRKAARKEGTQDILSVLAFARKHKQIDPRRIYLLGHSEGTAYAARIAQDPKHQIAGVISLGTMGLSGRDVFYMQNFLIGEGGPEEGFQSAGMLYLLWRALFDKSLPPLLLNEAKRSRDLRKVLRRARYWKGAFGYDGEALWGKVKCPVFFVNGGLDTQVPPGHAKFSALAARSAGNKDATWKILPGLDHTFRKATFGFMGEYADRFRPLAPSLVAAVKAFMARQLKPKPTTAPARR